MQRLPQELLDKIIDELADLEDFRNRRFARYSLVSKAWVERTRKYWFEHVKFDGLDALKDWRGRIAPDPAGVSCHTRALVFLNIHTVEGFEEHMRAFTRVEYMRIVLGSFLSPSVADCLAPMGSSLTRLDFHLSKTTSHAITSLLAKLPHLKSLASRCFTVTDDTGGSNSVSRIPFFEGNNPTLLRYFDCDEPRPPNWIPSSARFGGLEMITMYSPHIAVLLNQWFSSSCITLTSLVIDLNDVGEC